MPWVVGKVPRSTNDTERGELLTNLASMVQDAVAVVNDDESVEIEEAGGKTASADIYEKLISASNREISKAILGQTLTTEIDKGGSFAATKEHMEVRADLVDQDKRMVCDKFNKLFAWVTELNFDNAIPPLFKFYEE
jgi:phage gp29-like protein